MLGLCQRTLRKARQDGLLPYVLIGRAVRYTMGDLESYIESLRQSATSCIAPTPTRRVSRRSSAAIVPFSERAAKR